MVAVLRSNKFSYPVVDGVQQDTLRQYIVYRTPIHK